MNDQPRKGDRVRVSTRPYEATVVGDPMPEVVNPDGSTTLAAVTVRTDDGRHCTLVGEGWAVEIIERAKPPEPTGLGAVVRATLPSGAADLWVRVDHGGKAPWREVLSGAYDEDDACRRSWDQIPGPIEIVSPGVAEAAP